MDRTGTERALRALARRDLIRLASELKVSGRHRMKKDHLIQAIVLAGIYRSLPDSPDLLRRLTRDDLLRLCAWIGIEARKGARKGYLVEKILAQRAAKERDEPARSRHLRPPGEGEPARARGRTPSAAEPAPIVNGTLPTGYGETRVVLLAVDPYLVHAYWEVSERDMRRVEGLAKDGFSPWQAFLRFHDLTPLAAGGNRGSGSFDVRVEIESQNWYVRLLSPERTYMVDLGFRAQDGSFHRIARSNPVGTPRAWPCEETGEPRGKVAEGNGSAREDHLTERQPVRDKEPAAEGAGPAPWVRGPMEAHRAVAGLPGIGVSTAEPAGVPETKPSLRAVDTGKGDVQDGTREKPGTATPERALRFGDKGRESRPPQDARAIDAGVNMGMKPEEMHEPRKWKGLSGGKEAQESGRNPGETQESIAEDLCATCEDLFVSGVSSKTR
jgi:hypothetical protein